MPRQITFSCQLHFGTVLSQAKMRLELLDSSFLPILSLYWNVKATHLSLSNL